MATMKVLVVGGGASGGCGSIGESKCGGGGAGGYQYDPSFIVTAKTYGVTVGSGAGVNLNSVWGYNGHNGSNGSNSIFDTITAYGGGYGGGVPAGTSQKGGDGGCGGGGATTNSPATHGTGSQGYNGADGASNSYGGGGGGAGGAGSGNNGGVGIANPITGSTIGQNVSGTYYICGGGGGSATGVGGNGGGGNGGSGSGTSGTANTGGGGGGGGQACDGGGGGSGVVIISWVTANFGTCTVTGTGNTITTNGANSIATFIVSGNFTVVNASASSGTRRRFIRH